MANEHGAAEETREQKVEWLIEVWSDKTDSPIGQEARRDLLVTAWPELAEALQALAPIEYEPIVSAEELSEQVRQDAAELFRAAYASKTETEETEVVRSGE